VVMIVRPAKGFSMIELMIAVSIIGIMAAMATLGFDMVLDFRVRDVAANMHTSVMVARSEAIKRNTSVSISPIGTWSSGWSVAVGTQTIQTTRLPANISVSVENTGGPIAGAVSMNPMGRMADITSFGIESPGIAKRCVIVESDGRARVLVRQSTETACP
jgi:type IV fimbrial biogenesis protein FimT